MAKKEKFQLDKNFNFLYLIGFGVASILLVNSFIKYYKSKNKTTTTTPITDAIRSIKTGQVSVTNTPSKI
ncbi:MAG: hypothetical protein KGL95_01750 [Patescibacteria group bacterium]|nr:hypothetical protein [Patescibacteria group bacterium]